MAENVGQLIAHLTGRFNYFFEVELILFNGNLGNIYAEHVDGAWIAGNTFIYLFFFLPFGGYLL